MVLLRPEATWSRDWIDAAGEFCAKALSKRQPFRVVFLADPDQLWKVLGQGVGGDSGTVDWLTVGPWDEVFLEHWLKDNNLTADDAHRHRLANLSGCWPIALEQLFAPSRSATRAWEDRMATFEQAIERAAQREDWAAKLAINSDSVARVLQVLCDLDGFDSELAVLGMQEVGIEDTSASQHLEWAMRLGLVANNGAGGTLRVNSLVKALIVPETGAR